MNDLVRAAIDLVRADAQRSGAPGPPYIDGDWEFYDDVTQPDPELIVMVADRLQTDIIEGLWARRSPTNWPPCPVHPRTHPMRPVIADGRAMCACADGTPYDVIGSLFPSPRQRRSSGERKA
jgi:hypothetical protein